MKKRTPISKIMTTDILHVNKTQTLKEVAEIIKKEHIRHVPVLSGKKIIGMLSKVDLQKISFINTIEGENLNSVINDALTIEQVMTKTISTVQVSDLIYDVALILSKSEFHAIPVLDGEDLVGIVTSTDLIKYLVSQF
ncbi:CBS domain-containing protein [Bacteroidota bacterium]